MTSQPAGSPRERGGAGLRPRGEGRERKRKGVSVEVAKAMGRSDLLSAGVVYPTASSPRRASRNDVGGEGEGTGRPELGVACISAPRTLTPAASPCALGAGPGSSAAQAPSGVLVRGVV